MGRVNHFVLGFSGRIKSGKTTLAEAVATSLGYKRASFGDFVRSTARSEGHDSDDRAILQEIGQSLVLRGWENFCENVLNAAAWQHGEGLVVDGIRHVQAIAELKRLTTPLPFRLIHVDVDNEQRIARLQESEKKEVSNAEAHSTEHDVLAELPQLADIVVDGSLDLNVAVDRVISTFIS